MIEKLLRPEAYPEPPGEIHLLQTHISFVIITGQYVYKIKKPVDFGFLDFTTLDKRRFYCRQELDLNRRLSTDVYLDVVEITMEGRQVHCGGKGETVDYAIKMRRLPEEKKMFNLLKEGKVDINTMERVARVIADFHAGAETSREITSTGGLETVKKNVQENFSQTKKYIGTTLSEDEYRLIRTYSENFIEDKKGLFLKRMEEGRIRDCHGDIHMEHVYIMNGNIYIIDCIEFNDRFRYSDVAADVAFLAMDLDYYGHYGLSETLIKRYEKFSNDPEIEEFVNFYKCYRAYVRGKVDSFELDDPNLEVKEKEKIRGIASKYFKLAARYADR